MKKQDLQNFDIVKLRGGKSCMVNVDRGVLFSSSSYSNLEDYNENLKNKHCYRTLDIISVMRPTLPDDFPPSLWGGAPIIWERKERPELSHEEEVILRALNKPEYWIARDYHGLFLYKEKPVFETEWWASEGGSMTLYDHLFDFIEKDKDCYQVKDLLGDGGECDDYEVEEEPKYNVKIKVKSSFGSVGIFLYKDGDEVLAGDNFIAYHPKKDEFRLTEQEIRGFQNGDILFEHFAVKVEELEE